MKSGVYIIPFSEGCRNVGMTVVNVDNPLLSSVPPGNLYCDAGACSSREPVLWAEGINSFNLSGSGVKLGSDRRWETRASAMP